MKEKPKPNQPVISCKTNVRIKYCICSLLLFSACPPHLAKDVCMNYNLVGEILLRPPTPHSGGNFAGVSVCSCVPSDTVGVGGHQLQQEERWSR